MYSIICPSGTEVKCTSGSVGGARPCQGRGRGFESRLVLWDSVLLDPFLLYREEKFFLAAEYLILSAGKAW